MPKKKSSLRQGLAKKKLIKPVRKTPKASAGKPKRDLENFTKQVSPLEKPEHLNLIVDNRTGATYCQCHLRASDLVRLATIDVPLDPDEQSEYRANREILADHQAFQKMKDDAKKRRTFSDIVAEYTTDFDPKNPIKIIGGQHRFEAIRTALESGIDEFHGLKLYLRLTKKQRLDVQLISNTNIVVSRDLFDRMQETVGGPELRNWCQEAGILAPGKDFTDKYRRGGPISVQIARTFITNYYLGAKVDSKNFGRVNTTPVKCPTGQHDADWDQLKNDEPDLWSDPKLMAAAKEFAKLIGAQRLAFKNKRLNTEFANRRRATGPMICGG